MKQSASGRRKKTAFRMRSAMHQDTLERYMVALHFFSVILQDSPGEELLRVIAEEGLFRDYKNWECFHLPANKTRAVFPDLNTEQSIDALIEAYAPAGNDREYREHSLNVHMDHVALFSGPSPKSPPWESVWLERDKLLFGRQTEKVHNFYADWGIEIQQAGSEPEDHLGLELAFLLFLLHVDRTTPPEDAQKRVNVQKALRSFMDDHLLLWAGDCLSTASREASTVFYRELTKLCWAMLDNLYETLRMRGQRCG